MDQMSKKVKISLGFYAALVGHASADQPVSCLRTHATNNIWNFHVSKDVQKVNLFETKEVCTHQMPNRIQLIDSNMKWKFANEDIWRIEILPDFIARASFCPNGDTSKCRQEKIHGRWQDFYDQAMMVELDNNLRFLTNFRYEVKDELIKGKLVSNFSDKELSKIINNSNAADKDRYTSVCDQTMIGFVQNTEHKSTMDNLEVTCFYGEKVKIPGQFEDLVQLENAKSKWGRGKPGNLFQSHKPSHELDSYITWVN